MLAAPAVTETPLSPRRSWLPLALSAALHVLLALVWLGFPNSEHHGESEPAIEVELAAVPPAPPPASASAAAPAAKPAPSGDGEQGAPIPQLENGILAQRSSTPKLKDAAQSPPRPQVVPEPKPAAKPRKPEPVTQNERDFVLGQVLRHWSPPQDLNQFNKADVRVSVTVGADGYFGEAYDARRPWNPAEVFDGYAALPADSIQRRTVDAFLRAIRQAQPVRLPPALRDKAPFSVRLDFRFRDAR